MKLIILILALIISSLFRTELSAQWREINYPQGQNYGIKSNSSGLYVITDSGYYNSTNHGDTWLKINQTNISDSITEIEFTQNKIVASSSTATYISEDNGITWFRTFSGLRSFASLDSVILAGDFGFLYGSFDEGMTWSLLHGFFGPEYYPIGTISISTDIALLAYGYGGAFRSTNNGLNWTQCLSSNGLNHASVSAFAGYGNYSFAIKVFGDGNGLYRSTDLGIHWTQLSNEYYINSLLTFQSNLAIGKTDGIFISKDNGISWINKNQGFDNFRNANVFYSDGEFLYARSNSKYWKRSINEIIDYWPNDVGLITISVPENLDSIYIDGCTSDTSVQVKAIIKNYGFLNQTNNLEIVAQIWKESVMIEEFRKQDTISSNNIHETELGYFRIPDGNQENLGLYKIKSWTILPGDSNQFNDTTSSAFKVYSKNYYIADYFHNHPSYYFANSSTSNYCITDSPNYYWIDTAGSITLISNGIPVEQLSGGNIDNGYFTIQNIFPPGEGFEFFSRTYNYFKISTNGIIGVGSEAVGMTNSEPGPLPNYNTGVGPAICAFWTDLDYGDSDVHGRNLKYKKEGNLLVITYDKAPLKNIAFDSTYYVSFQVILEPIMTTNGTITIQFDESKCGSSFNSEYKSNSLPSHTIGLQDFAAYSGVQYRYRNSSGSIITPGPLYDQPFGPNRLAVSFGRYNYLLPVELVSLSSEVTENQVSLYWQTDSEKDNYGFEIQRSVKKRIG